MDSYPVHLEIPVAWGDMDAFGHVNNTVYFRWFESGRMALFERIGIGSERPERVGPILASTSCEFLAPVVLIDYATGAKVRVPDEMRAAFAALS